MWWTKYISRTHSLLLFGGILIMQGCSGVRTTLIPSEAVLNPLQGNQLYSFSAPCVLDVRTFKTRTIRINYHIVLPDGQMGNLSLEAVSPYLQSMTNALNHWLAQNITWRNDQQNVHFEGTLLQVTIQSLSDSGWDDGVYYHEIQAIPEDYIWKERDVQQLAEQFGIQTQSVVNIFVLPDARLGGQRRQCDSGLSGLISGTSMLLTGLFDDARFPREHADCMAKMLINMIQQETDKMTPSVLTMMGNEEDKTSNCYMHQILGIPAHSLHPMQVPAWCEAERPVEISGREIWKGDQHVIGDLHILNKGHLTIQGNLSLPEGAKIHIHPGGILMMEKDFRNICKEPWDKIVIYKKGFRSGKLILPDKKHATSSAK